MSPLLKHIMFSVVYGFAFTVNLSFFMKHSPLWTQLLSKLNPKHPLWERHTFWHSVHWGSSESTSSHLSGSGVLIFVPLQAPGTPLKAIWFMHKHMTYMIPHSLYQYKLEKVLDLSTHTMEFCHPSMPAWFSGPCSISIMSAIFGRTCKRAFFPTTVILTKAGIRASWVITANSSFRASIRWARY